MTIMAVSDDSFEQDVLQAAEPVVVDFWAEWCGPCRMLHPILEDVSVKMSGRVRIVKINIDQNPSVPMRYNVRAVPALLLFRNGNVVASKVGLLPASKLIEWITSNS
ncbi:thioredoxin [Methylobacterium sp. SyP6R]|uniref:thioredoxin n=1 Tax=Methylobacterium sp. SyP6R TaxID=2718876 RepID=UPI001F01EB0A|nr:thioredoxin [Methylobacterium sp. SyP6R]MCF4124512.1 thioredoxin [Methylobacterium sp. SyP6R]